MQLRLAEISSSLFLSLGCFTGSLALCDAALAKSLPSLPADSSWVQSADNIQTEENHKAALLTPPEPKQGQVSKRERKIDGGNHSPWIHYFEAAQRDFDARRYAACEAKLISSIKVAKQAPSNDRDMALSRILLARVYLCKEKNNEASKLFDLALNQTKKIFGEESREAADCYQGQAQINFLEGRFTQAEVLCKKAVSIRERELGHSHNLAQSLILLAEILAKTNWVEASEETIRGAITMSEEFPGPNILDLADSLRHGALLMQKHGQTAIAEAWFDKCYRIIDKEAKLNLPSQTEGEMLMRWEEGSPRAQEIPDSDFPLRYLSINNVRVAATLVDLWELEGVLISITNTGDQRVTLGLGKPTLFSQSTDEFAPRTQKMEFIDPNGIDKIRRERGMWDLTQNRPWLANMQKSRSQRGFVPSTGHDLFRGPNVFGVYGEWNALGRDLPQTLMLEPSPENVQYQAEVVVDPGVVHSSQGKMPNLVSITLEPFESRTGELFFLNTRPEKMLLKVPVGNVMYEIPFSARRKRIK
ncbi:MAG: tetratricopeptide repeat protein [Candidatus Obscuribacterales bacterium]|nr:tetratricopeptide repeat protein [Candidatus Obscuribacterales bacterium]